MPYKNLEQRRIRDRAWYKANQKTEQARLTKDYIRRHATPKGRLVNLVGGARQRARQFGMDFDISAADLCVPERCPILDIPISLASDAKRFSRPSLDRIDNSRGYVKGNVAVISGLANSWKSNKTLADVQRLAAYMEANALLG